MVYNKLINGFRWLSMVLDSKNGFDNDIKIWENLEMIVRKVTSSNIVIYHQTWGSYSECLQIMGKKIWDSYWIQSKLGQFILGWSPIKVAVGTEPGDIYIIIYVCVSVYCSIYIHVCIVIYIYIHNYILYMCVCILLYIYYYI